MDVQKKKSKNHGRVLYLYGSTLFYLSKHKNNQFSELAKNVSNELLSIMLWS